MFRAGEEDTPKPAAPPLCAAGSIVDTHASMKPFQISHFQKSVFAHGMRRVLVVDDHAGTLAAVAALLQQEYPRIDVVGTASDCATALQLLHDVSPDLVVLDLDLGDEHGLDLMPAIRRFPGIDVVILSASDDPLARIRAAGAGAIAFISKFSPAEELIATVLAARL